MTQQEKLNLNRRVALALGEACYRIVERSRERFEWCKRWDAEMLPEALKWYEEFGECLGDPPIAPKCFCTDPAAADLVRKEFRRRRVAYTENYLPAIPGLRDKDMLCVHWSLGEGIDCDTHWGSPDDFTALCLAFLAACDAENTPQ